MDAVERGDAVDVDEMRGLGQPERHGGHEALAAGEHAAVLRRDLGQQRDRFVDGFRRVVAKRRGLHRLVSTLGLTYLFELMHGFWHRVKARQGARKAGQLG